MKKCNQTKDQNVYEHGLSVWEYTKEIIKFLKDEDYNKNIIIPKEFYIHKEKLLNSLIDLDRIKEYTIFHDVGKVYCISYDEFGKVHFPNHAEISSQIWLKLGGDPIVARCMKHDMDIHKIKANEVEEFLKIPEAITLLIVGLAEINSNAISLFGGTDSTSFKIKYKQIERRSREIFRRLFWS